MGAGCACPARASAPLARARPPAAGGPPVAGAPPIAQARAVLRCLAEQDELLRRLQRERRKSRRLWRRSCAGRHPGTVAAGYLGDVAASLAVLAGTLRLAGCVRRWRARSGGG